MKVLVVDDSDVDRLLIGGLLGEESDWTLQYAVNGREALERIRSEPPDLVITDLQMPEMDGLELVQQARRGFLQLPFILVTSQGSEDIAYRALACGATSYVPKRQLNDDLVRTVRQVVDHLTRERYQHRLLERRIFHEAVYELENDPQLVSPLVGLLQDEVTRMGLCDEADRMRVGIALEEAIVNALYHGNLEMESELRERNLVEWRSIVERRQNETPYRERRIEVRAAVTRDQATFVIRDQGLGFDPGNVPDPTDPANLEKVSGRGLLLMRTFMDELRHDDRGRQVTLIKRRKNGSCAS